MTSGYLVTIHDTPAQDSESHFEQWLMVALKVHAYTLQMEIYGNMVIKVSLYVVYIHLPGTVHPFQETLISRNWLNEPEHQIIRNVMLNGSVIFEVLVLIVS